MTLTWSMDEGPPAETSALLHNNGRWRVPSGLGTWRCLCACAIPSALALNPALISRDERQPGAFWHYTPLCEHVTQTSCHLASIGRPSAMSTLHHEVLQQDRYLSFIEMLATSDQVL